MVAVLEHDIFEVRLEGQTNANTRWNLVFHLQAENESGEEQYEAALSLATLVHQRFVLEMIPLMADTYNLVSTRCSSIYPQLGPPFVFVSATPTPGGQSDEGMPPDVALVITKRTAQASRSFLGRNYFTGVTRAGVENDVVLPASRAGYASAAENLLADPYDTSGSGTYSPVVFSRKLANLSTPAENAAAIIEHIELDAVTRNMRTRGLKYRLPASGLE